MPNIPFSLSDILERIVPGALFLAMLFVAFGDFIEFENNFSITPSIWIGLTAAAYASGVFLNISQIFWDTPNSKDYWSAPNAEHNELIKSAVKEHFSLEENFEKSWALCYGTCTKHAYSTNTEIFSGLVVFCKSMMMLSVCAVISFLISIILNYFIKQQFDFHELFVVVICGALACMFRKGVYIYDKAFVGAVHEGFYSWYCENKNTT